MTGGVQNGAFLLRGPITTFKAKVGGSGVDIRSKPSRLDWFVLVPAQKLMLNSICVSLADQ